MATTDLDALISAVSEGTLVPYLGPGAVADITHLSDGSPMPADSDSLILAMNNGTPMAPRLMFEFPRAAMHMEHKKGRSYVVKFFERLYKENQWTRGVVHDWLAQVKPPYVVDINRDTQLQESYSATPHTLIQGISRIGGTDYRFRLFHYDGNEYKEIEQDAVDTSLPVLFKPLGTPIPEPSYIAADADFVDYITELMGGFAIPDFLKETRKNKQYLYIGMRFQRDTERMVMSDITYAAGEPAGYALMPECTEKEKRYLDKKGVVMVDASISDLIMAAGLGLPARASA